MFGWESILVVLVIALGGALGFAHGRGLFSSAPPPPRLHKTISFDRAHQADDAELDAEMEAADAGSDEPSEGRKRSDSVSSQSSQSSDEEIAAEDAEEDLQSTLEHMKEEHRLHTEQFEEAHAANRAGMISPDPSSPPLPLDAHRRIFIVAKSLPLNIVDITGQQTPSQTPAGSPLTGPSVAPVPEGSNGVDDDEFSLGQTAASAAAPAPAPSKNRFDAKRGSVFGFATSRPLPHSSVVVQGESKFDVQWDDSRSFLSNLRCLLRPTPVATAVKDVNPSALPPGLSVVGGSNAIVDEAEVTWLGMSNVSNAADFKSEAEKTAYEAALKENHCLPVYLEPGVQEGYTSFCRSILWPLLHYMLPWNTNQHVGERWTEFWTAYQRANQAYADTLCEAMKPNDIVWIHNMHLFCLPRMIREKHPRATIGLFIHTPFPSSDVFRALPSRRELLESMLEASLIGFHTFDYARHFLSCIKRVMDLDFETLPGGVLGVRHQGRFVSILISHVGIQSQVFHEAAESDILKRRVEKLRAEHAGKKIIIGVNDVDVAKSPILKLQAFDRFLTRHPEWKSKIVILEMFLPSRNMESELGKKIQKDLDDYILLLKSKYGDGIIQIIQPLRKRSTATDAHGKPLEPQGLKLLELVRLYNAADVALVLTTFDGLNVLPYEFTASQGSSLPGALVISEFMGCSRSLNGVLRVNPWSMESISDALHTALSMTADERRANHARRYNYVMHHTAERWANGFLDNLARATKLGDELNYVSVGSGASHRLLGLRQSFSHLPTTQMVTTYAAAELRVILLDYDGTLVPADKNASACQVGPPSAVVKLLKFLSEAPNTVCFLMSGRTRAVLSEWFGDLPHLGLAAEKGLFLRWPESLAAECRFDRKTATADEQVVRKGASSTEVSSSDSDDSDAEADEHKEAAVLSPRSALQLSEWECTVPLIDLSWKATAMEIIRSYTEQTDGSWIEDKEFAIVWHYEQADVEYGRMQSSEIQKVLVKVLANPQVDVMRYDKTRILEVKPHGVSKGLAATAILESLWIRSEKQRTEAAAAASPASPLSPATPASAPVVLPSSSRFGLQVSPPPRTPAPRSPEADLISPRSAATPFHPFVLAIGDDRSDEDMFISIQQKLYLDGRVRGRERTPYVDSLLPRFASSPSSVPTSVPQPPTFAFHDPEISPTPVSPLGGAPSARALRASSPPSSDPYLFSVCVGMKPSNAHYYLNDVSEVLRSLYGLVLSDQENKSASATSSTGLSREDKRLGLTKRGHASSNADIGGGMGPKRGSFGALTSLLFGANKPE